MESPTVFEVGRHVDELDVCAARGMAVALHELRKLNGVVKVVAERALRQFKEDSSDPSKLPLRRIWRTAEMMSQQFDIIEILATGQLSALPLSDPIHLRQVMERCREIYGDELLRLETVVVGLRDDRMRACERTFAIIPMVLIDNALRHSVSGSSVLIQLSGHGNTVELSVSNDVTGDEPLDDRIYEQGYRGARSTGSGNGLFVAQQVARQHHTVIRVACEETDAGVRRCTFRVSFNLLEGPSDVDVV
jgi:signal transduction histidine kinase